MKTIEAPKAATEVVGRLRDLVGANSRRWKTVILLEALGLAVAAPLGYLWLVFLLDNYWHLSLFGRVIASCGLLIGVAGALTHLARRWRSIRLSEDQVALAIERRTPGGVQNRLINALQLARGDRSAAQPLSDAAVEENCARLEQIHLEQAAQMRPAILRMGLAGFLILAGLAFWFAAPDQFSNAATRIFLPLAKIDPLYRTVLIVEPGDIEGAGEVSIEITIQGERPKNLLVTKSVEGKRSSERIPVDTTDGPVRYTFRDVRQSLTYTVRGGDFLSPEYRIDVPQRATLSRMRVTYQYPAYTGAAEKTVESRSGDLEGLLGSRAQITFTFDQAVDSAAILVERGRKNHEAIVLKPLNAKEFVGEIVLEDAHAYRLETVQGDRPKERSAAHAIRILKDAEPKLELTGIERRSELPIDAAISLSLTATDDYGLEQVGLFYRRLGASVANASGSSRKVEDSWQPIEIWPADKKKAFAKKDIVLAVAALQGAEGDKIELAARAIDTDPTRKGMWTTGAIHEINIGGDGAALQVQYEQILRSEKELRRLLLAEQESLNRTVVWLRKLDAGSGIRWDDAKNVDALHDAVKSLIKDQQATQKDAGLAANAMLPQTGNLRIAVSMLADTEMVRVQRIFDAVPSRDKPQDKRAALADARLTQERIIRSLEEMLEQYQAFRSDWELSYMIPFTKMLAERQTKMRDHSRKKAGQTSDKTEDLARLSMHRRQAKMLDLCKLIQPAFVGLATRLEAQEPSMASAFLSASQSLANDDLLKPLADAADAAKSGRWLDAAKQQTLAAERLTAIHDTLRKAQVEAAQKALAALKEKAKSDLEAQKEIDKLDPGTAEAFLKELPDKIKLEDLMRVQAVVGAKKRTDANPGEEPDFKNAPLVEVDRKRIELDKDSGVRQDPYSLRLGNIAEKTPILKLPKDSKPNAVKPFMQEQFDDLVGKLLDETEELHKNYQSLKLSTNQNNNDPGEIGKVGGTLNSTGAVAATGNKKPPTTESGGLSRTGRQGARATGMIADDEGVDRRGRDKALEGTERIADQPGTMKMKKSDDMQKDGSTGVGGKKVESDDTHFSLHDAGKWKDDFVKRMEKPQKKQYIVERQGDKIDAATAMLLRDLTSKQEQVIERLKAIKKELRNLYLPTDHLDELAAQLDANLASLKEQPDPELFRQQVQTLDKLRGAMRVFRGASAGFQPSLPRERAIRGRVLDEPATQALPGYEDAVRQYYLKLAGQ